MQALPGSSEFILRLEGVRAENYRLRADACAAAGMNPDGPEGSKRFGRAVAYVNRAVVRAHLLTQDDLGRLDEMEEWATRKGMELMLDVVPVPECAAVTIELSGRGYSLFRWQPTLVRDLSLPLGPPPDGVEVEALGTSASDEFRATFLGEDADESTPAGEPYLSMVWKAEGAQHFFARRAGAPISAGNLVTIDGIARLSNAATVPKARRQGGHAALIHARLKAAADAGLPLAVTDTARPNSMRNLVRAGFSIAMQTTQWRKL